jgi:hypothetical protein
VTGRRGRRRKRLLRSSTRLHSVDNSLWKRLWTRRKTDYEVKSVIHTRAAKFSTYDGQPQCSRAPPRLLFTVVSLLLQPRVKATSQIGDSYLYCFVSRHVFLSGGLIQIRLHLTWHPSIIPNYTKTKLKLLYISLKISDSYKHTQTQLSITRKAHTACCSYTHSSPQYYLLPFVIS